MIAGMECSIRPVTPTHTVRKGRPRAAPGQVSAPRGPSRPLSVPTSLSSHRRDVGGPKGAPEGDLRRLRACLGRGRSSGDASSPRTSWTRTARGGLRATQPDLLRFRSHAARQDCLAKGDPAWTDRGRPGRQRAEAGLEGHLQGLRDRLDVHPEAFRQRGDEASAKRRAHAAFQSEAYLVDRERSHGPSMLSSCISASDRRAQSASGRRLWRKSLRHHHGRSSESCRHSGVRGDMPRFRRQATAQGRPHPLFSLVRITRRQLAAY